MVKSCCVLGCKQRYSKDSGVSFHRFPAEPELKEQWVKAVARHDWQPSYHSLVCGKHFITGRPSAEPEHPDFIPSLFPHISMYQKYRSTYAKRVLLMSDTTPSTLLQSVPEGPSTSQAGSGSILDDPSQESILNEVEVEFVTQESTSKRPAETAAADTSSCKKRKNTKPRRFIPHPRKHLPAPPIDHSNAEPHSGRTIFGLPEKLVQNRLDEHMIEIQKEMQSQMRKQQSEIQLLQVQVDMLREKNSRLAKEPKPTSRDVLSDVYLTDKSRCYYYTGLPNNESFLWLLSLIENEVQKPSVKITSSKQLLLVLMKLKLDLQHIDLGYRFGIAASTVCRILKFWVPILMKNLQAFLENHDKDAVLNSLLEGDIDENELAEYKTWPDKILGKAVTFTNGLKATPKS